MATTRGSNEKSGSSLDLLWGDRTKPQRSARPGLSAERIVAAAIELADAEGLDALSMQRVANMLDFTTMSIYRYFPGKSQLIDVMMDTAAGSPPDLPEAAGWRERVELWMAALWDRYQQHPWMLQVQVSGPPVGPNQLAWLEAALRSLRDTGLTHNEMLSVSLFLNGAVTGLARLTSDVAHAAAAIGVDQRDMNSEYVQTLERVLDSERFPTLSAIVAAGAFQPGDAPDSDTRGFSFALRRLLDGIEGYLEERADQHR
ncbi:TetR/AcrR family transcriptional regulator [Streptomyces millisiae]|uniref:TetR/AcrR family transcriptional regulator n=1 Tax=Streptomyces millisiae TaxID=3075542 RepID=A0ABU2LQD7_9ACTN|nr:TetR/AcrR family transcriptional regulator [Streptomyces sp. DSM 44918]MDT0319807.1 TetR/AcrR family transcriptional regulator [Streptomyces sp. DSM 44918]